MLLIIVGTLIGMVMPQLMKVLIDDIIGNGKYGFVGRISFLMVFVTLFQALMDFLQSYIIVTAGV
jgi:ABC-type bacteriocin/lantibiotic exporter with double-glycine peptidase domain